MHRFVVAAAVVMMAPWLSGVTADASSSGDTRFNRFVLTAQSKPASGQPAGSSAPCDERFEFFTIDGQHIGWLDDKTGQFHIDGDFSDDRPGTDPAVHGVALSATSDGGLSGSTKFSTTTDMAVLVNFQYVYDSGFEVSPDGMTARLRLNVAIFGPSASGSNELVWRYQTYLAVAQRCGKKTGSTGNAQTAGGGKPETSGTPEAVKSGIPGSDSGKPVSTPGLGSAPGAGGAGFGPMTSTQPPCDNTFKDPEMPGVKARFDPQKKSIVIEFPDGRVFTGTSSGGADDYLGPNQYKNDMRNEGGEPVGTAYLNYRPPGGPYDPELGFSLTEFGNAKQLYFRGSLCGKSTTSDSKTPGGGKPGTSGTPEAVKSGILPGGDPGKPVSTPGLPGGPSVTDMLNYLLNTGQVDSSVQKMGIDGGGVVGSMNSGMTPSSTLATARSGIARFLVASLLNRPGARQVSAARRDNARVVSRPATDPRLHLDRSWSVGQREGGSLQATLVSVGGSTGDVFELRIVTPPGQPARFTIPESMVVEPLRSGTVKNAPVGANSQVQTFTVAAYCLDFAKAPPPPGVLFRVAASAVQQKHAFVGRVFRAARALDAAKRLRPDSEPKSYLDAVKQYALWARIEGWNEKTFGERFLDRTKKNFAELKQRWTKDIEAAVRAAAPGRWRDISAVLAEADRLASTRPQ